ncbi:MAG: response regulator transcription factor [Anaerolineales bacterium]|nr:response regulator transcription factor [Anaerolineales bacterium]
MPHTILAVDDDRKTAELLRLYLERDGYQALTAGDGLTALALARERQPDLIVLDVMLPRVDGLDVCEALRAESEVPIILLTARTTEADKLAGLEAGADDYVTKPFSPRELLARVRAVLRRTRPPAPPPALITAGALQIDVRQHVVRLHGERVAVTPREFRLLQVLAREPGRVFSRAELLEHAFGPLYDGQERTVDVHLMNLRRKIEPDLAQPVFIQTVFGVGYCFGGPADVD